MRLALPVIKADYQAFDAYSCADDVKVATPIHAMGGDQDPYITLGDLYGWGKHTDTVKVTMFDGGHFYLNVAHRRRRGVVGVERAMRANRVSDNGSAVTAATDPIVISGMAVEAPGGIDSPGALWSALTESRELLGPFPRDRGWTVDDLLSASRVEDGWRQVCDSGGFLDGAAIIRSALLRPDPPRGDGDAPAAAGRDAGGVEGAGERRDQSRRRSKARMAAVSSECR